VSLPVGLILWAGNNSLHLDHLHVEGLPKKTGTPPLTNPGMTPAVAEIYDALRTHFGSAKYFLDPAPADWTHMGWYNRRKIAGTNIWSQHSWSNALDIGPYWGVAEQQPFYDFLTGALVEPKVPVQSWAVGAYEWAITHRIYTNPDQVADIRETVEAQRQMVFLHRHHNQLGHGSAVPGLQRGDSVTLV
jgi:hypothetical protein